LLDETPFLVNHLPLSPLLYLFNLEHAPETARRGSRASKEITAVQTFVAGNLKPIGLPRCRAVVGRV